MHRTATRRRTLGRFHYGLCGVAISVLAGPVAIAAQPPASSSTVVTHTLTVSRFNGVDDFTEDNAQEIIAHMARILLTDDDGTGPNDVGCDVNFTLAGVVETFDDGYGEVVSEQDFQEIINLPGDVKVVEDVRWCKDTIGNIGACSDRNTFVVETGLPLATAGSLWAHEFGHVRGLEHRHDEPTMVMNAVVSDRSQQVEDWECRQYR